MLWRNHAVLRKEQARNERGEFTSGDGGGKDGKWGKDPSEMSRDDAVKEIRSGIDKATAADRPSKETIAAIKSRVAWIEEHHPGAEKEAWKKNGSKS